MTVCWTSSVRCILDDQCQNDGLRIEIQNETLETLYVQRITTQSQRCYHIFPGSNSSSTLSGRRCLSLHIIRFSDLWVFSHLSLGLLTWRQILMSWMSKDFSCAWILANTQRVIWSQTYTKHVKFQSYMVSIALVWQSFWHAMANSLSLKEEKPGWLSM